MPPHGRLFPNPPPTRPPNDKQNPPMGLIDPPKLEPPKDEPKPPEGWIDPWPPRHPRRQQQPKQKGGQSSPIPFPKLSLFKKLKNPFKSQNKRKSFLTKTDEDIKRELQKDQNRDLKFKKNKR